jgi:GMP synthase-like glutamine amidotransferase
MHRDIVYSYPAGAEPLGSSSACSVQGMYTPGRFIAIQGHPEFTSDIMREILETRHATGIFDEEAYKEHAKKIDLPHDGIVVSQSFIRFLLEI